MVCYTPLTAYYSKEVSKHTGRRGITFDRGASFSGVKLSLPCGQCIGCRLARSLQWGIRCMHEKQMHDMSSFVTLTYDDDFLPEGGTLVKSDVQKFLKRLRERLKVKGIRYYMCGEYGERTNRPHYHILFFNLDFLDKKFYKTAKAGEKLYTSELLREIWPFGHNVIGDVTLESCCYVARYIVGKVLGDKADDWYMGRLPEYTDMSRRPGIGSTWYERYGVHSHKSGDFAVLSGKRVRMPRFYDTRYELVDASALSVLKVRRRRSALVHRKDGMVDRRRVRERVALARLSMSKREF